MEDIKKHRGTGCALCPVSAAIIPCREKEMLPWDDDADWQLSFR